MGALTRYGNLNRNAAGQQGTGPEAAGGAGSELVSVLAGPVDIVAINGMLLRSPAPGQQVREVGRAAAAP